MPGHQYPARRGGGLLQCGRSACLGHRTAAEPLQRNDPLDPLGCQQGPGGRARCHRPPGADAAPDPGRYHDPAPGPERPAQWHLCRSGLRWQPHGLPAGRQGGLSSSCFRLPDPKSLGPCPEPHTFDLPGTSPDHHPMIATQIRQKDASFYFVSYPCEDILRRVRFISRFYADGEAPIAADEAGKGDEVAGFIQKIERSDAAFQRSMSHGKIKAIRNFYETAVAQPPIPGTVLLFSSDILDFSPLGNYKNVGDLKEPKDKYLIIDGQHRLAALEFYMRSHPQEAKSI